MGTNGSRPMLCEVCGRFAELDWHSITTDHESVEECAASVNSGGAGYWLCSELCHTTAHELMKEECGEGKAAKVIGSMIRRLAEAVCANARKYQKRGGNDGR